MDTEIPSKLREVTGQDRQSPFRLLVRFNGVWSNGLNYTSVSGIVRQAIVDQRVFPPDGYERPLYMFFEPATFSDQKTVVTSITLAPPRK
jgi:hypothetical protein